MSLDSIYPYIPIAMQNVLCSGYGYLLNKRRYGNDYDDLERVVFQRECLSADEMHHLQCARLNHMVMHAAKAIPYYRKLFGRLGIDPRSIREPSDLKQLPILTKAIVQDNIQEFISESMNRNQVSTWKTSGTTGTSLVFPMELRAEQEQWAVWWRYRARFGIDHSTWYAHFYGRSIVPVKQQRPPYWRTNYAGRQILFSAYHMTEQNMKYYVQELNRRQPPWIQGYPSLISVLASYMLSTGDMLDYTPMVVTVGAESLLPQQKGMIESAFGAKCRQHYGTTESVGNISECVEGRLHVDEDFGYMEFLENDYGALELHSTGFANTAFVLFRYKVGDTVTVASEAAKCSCGNPGRLVESIDGRIEDYVLTPRGARIGRLDHILKDMTNIRECQIVQEATNAVQFRVVRRAEYSKADEAKLRLEAQRRLGAEMDIEIRYVDELERSSRGKLRFVISRLEQGKLVKAN
jgi:phenylacetate-CoA ligase